MTENSNWYYNNAEFRVPCRVLIPYQSIFELIGVNVYENTADTRALTMSLGKALFEIIDDFGTIEIQQSELYVTENVINIQGWCFGRIRLGHFHCFLNPAGTITPVYVITANQGYTYGGNGGIVSLSHTIYDTDVLLIAAAEKDSFMILAN